MRGRTLDLEVVDKRGKAAKTIPLYQYDYGQKLIIKGVELPEYYEVHFSNQQYGEAVTVLGDSTGVLIPDSLVATGESIYVWLYLHDTSYDGETEYMGVIPVIKRAEPSDVTPTPEEQSIVTEVIAALNNMEDDMSDQVNEAKAAKEAAEDAQAVAEAAESAVEGYASAAATAKEAAEIAQTAAETAQAAAEAASNAATTAYNNADSARASAVSAKEYAETAATNASNSATSASNSATSASNSASAAEGYETAAETAQGKAEDAQAAAETAQAAAEAAEDSVEADALIAEGYAVGKQNGDDVTSGSTYYHNNAKYYAEQAENYISSVIDDTAGEGDTDVTWSADKLSDELGDVLNAIQGLRKTYNTVENMVADTTLAAGMNVETKGYYSAEDNGCAEYTISSTHDGNFYIELNNGLYANMVTEKGWIPAERLGLRSYEETTAEPDEDIMSTNTEHLQKAITNGVLVDFGKGHYYFDDAINLDYRGGAYRIRGIDRMVSVLHFPTSKGFVFTETIYYNYWFIEKIGIISYSDCIFVQENVCNLIDCHFENLRLKSATGNCVTAPTYNVSKFYDTLGRLIYDSCLQNNVFDVINGEAPAGAVFANIMGLGNQFKHLNIIGSTKYGFRNCDGRVEHLNTLGTGQDHMFYYDKAYSHSLNLLLIEVNAEGLLKSFIHTEPYVDVQPGEDVRKPENANVMTLSSLILINSGWDLQSSVSDNTYYPINVQAIRRINVMGTRSFIPSHYPASYDTTEVKGIIRETFRFGLEEYTGERDFIDVATSLGYLYRITGRNNNDVLGPGQGHSEDGLTQTEVKNVFMAKQLYGGKATYIYRINSSDIDGVAVAPPNEYKYCDIIDIRVNDVENKNINTILATSGIETPGRIVTIVNRDTSTGNIVLRPQSSTVGTRGAFAIKDAITLPPKSSMTFVSVFHTYSNATYIAWKPVEFVNSDITEVNVSGTTPIINGESGVTYYCGEVSSIEIIPPNTGTIEVYFRSGATATNLTLPRAVSLPTGFDPSDLDTNTTYKIRIKNRIYGEVETFVDQPYVNLLNPSTFVDNNVWYQGIMYNGYTANCATPKVQIEPGKEYILIRESAGQNYVCWFDENQDYISQEAWDTGRTKVIASNVHYVGISIAITDKNNAILAEY